jgi:hypothetical protein
MEIGMDNIESVLRVLDNGWFITEEEMAIVARILRECKKDADRYRWLNKSTAQLFMVTEKQMDDEIDRAINGGRE